MADAIDSLVRWARANCPPNMADDIEQEMRIAAWLAARDGRSVGYIRLRVRGAMLDYLRAQRKSRRAERPVFIDIDMDELADEVREPCELIALDTDLALLCAVVLNSQAAVAAAFGVKAPRMSRNVKRARQRVAVRV